MIIHVDLTTVPSTRNCSMNRAIYTLRGKPDITASSRYRVPTSEYPSDIEFTVTSTKTGVEFRFLPFVAGSGLGVKSHLLRLKANGHIPAAALVRSDDEDVTDFLAADKWYKFTGTYLMRMNSAAPDYLLIPGLQALFWYDNPERREGIPIAFFDRTCPP